MPNHLTPDEQRRLDEIEAALADLRAEKAAIRNRERQRRFQARQKAQN